MRIANRLILNATTSYARLATTFLLGIFFTWLMVGQAGLVGFGVVALSMGTFGMSAVDGAIRQSVLRELSAAIATGRAERMQRTLASGMAYCAGAGAVILLAHLGFAALAWIGFFRAPPELTGALAALMAAEGAVVGVRMVLAPYTQTIYAAQRVGLDNLLGVLQRAAIVVAAVLALAVVRPAGDVGERLIAFAVLRVAISVAETLFEALLARRLRPELVLRRRAFDRAEFRAIAGTVWHTGQMTLLANASPKLLMVIINLLFGLAFNGMWQIALQVGGHAKLAAEGILRGVDALSTHLHEEGRRDALIRLMLATTRYQLLAILPFAAAYAIFITPILTLWVGARLAEDESLTAAGIAPEAAIRTTAIMASIMLLAEVFRMSGRAVERILYGIGEVRSYAWFAKYAMVLATGGGGLAMWLGGSAVLAAVAVAAANAVFAVVIFRAGGSHGGLTLRDLPARSFARPLIVGGLVALPLGLVPCRVVDALDLIGLIALLLGVGAILAPLLYAIGLEGAGAIATEGNGEWRELKS